MENNSDKGIRKIFSEIPRSYDLTNRILTFGLDILWRKKAAKIALSSSGLRCLDVCSGTADMANSLYKLAGAKTQIVALDFCFPMLREAAKKTVKKKISFCVSNADTLPFADNTFDLLTISFATRNINISPKILLRHFQEFHRVLKPDGRFVNLETSQPLSLALRRLFHFYVRLAVKPIGYLISGSKAAYAYLSYTIPHFFSAEELSRIIYQAGFRKVDLAYLSFGISAIHIAIK